MADSNVHHEHRQPRDAGVMHGGWATDFSDASRDTEDRAQIRGIGPQIGIELYCRIVLRVPLRVLFRKSGLIYKMNGRTKQ